MQETLNKKAFSRRSFVGALGSGAVLSTVPAYAWKAGAKVYPDVHRDVIIVGSGFGGAVTALRLTESGIPVMMIEQGRRWDQPLPRGERRFSKNIYPDGRCAWLSNKTVVPLGPPLPINKTTGVLQARQLAGKTVLNGAAYGGGSIVYGGILVKPEKKVYELVFPKEIPYEELERHYETVSSKLKSSIIPEDVLQADCYKHVRVAAEQADRAGIEWEHITTGTDWEVVRDEISGKIPPSITQGEAVYGVNSGAKSTLDNSYLKEAEATGLLELRTLHQVQEIGVSGDGTYWIQCNELDIDGDVVAKRRYTCRKLFLAAGTVGTSGLLVKAKTKGTLPRLNNEVGKGWGSNGNAYALRLAVNASTGQWQGGPPTLVMKQLDHPLTPLNVEHPQLPLGVDIFGLLYFSVGISETRGEFSYNADKDEVTIDWPKYDKGQELVNEALLDTMKRLNEANGGITTSLLTYLKDRVKDDIAYHPLGGCVLGKATDFYGRVKGYKGLYVNDGAFMPGSAACTNPSLTIAALAERNMEKILAEDF